MDIEHVSSTSRIQHDLWPLDEISPLNAKFPCCLVWTPLPVVSWLAPFIGHVGICREDGAIFDFSGSYFVTIDNFHLVPPPDISNFIEKSVAFLPTSVSIHALQASHIRSMGQLSRGMTRCCQVSEASSTELTTSLHAIATHLWRTV